MGRFVIVAYKPRPGRAQALLDVLAGHLRVLTTEGLVTDRSASVMRAADGTLVEVFEWASLEAIERAHRSPAVAALWAEFGAAWKFVPIASLVEAQQLFAEFEPVVL